MTQQKSTKSVVLHYENFLSVLHKKVKQKANFCFYQFLNSLSPSKLISYHIFHYIL